MTWQFSPRRHSHGSQGLHGLSSQQKQGPQPHSPLLPFCSVHCGVQGTGKGAVGSWGSCGLDQKWTPHPLIHLEGSLFISSPQGGPFRSQAGGGDTGRGGGPGIHSPAWAEEGEEQVHVSTWVPRSATVSSQLSRTSPL